MERGGDKWGRGKGKGRGEVRRVRTDYDESFLGGLGEGLDL